MRTKKVEVEIKNNGSGSVEIRGRRVGEDAEVSIILSPTKAFSFYQVLMGRRVSDVAKRVRDGITSYLAIFPAEDKEGEEEGKDKAEGKSDTEFRIVHLQQQEGENTKKVVFSLSIPGRVLLAGELGSAIASTLQNGGFMEFTSENMTFISVGNRLRAIVSGEPVRIPMRNIRILEGALKIRKDVKLGDIELRNGKFFLKGQQLTPKQELEFIGLMEILSSGGAS